MKKLLLMFSAAVLMSVSASAQQLQKNIFGVRAGVNIAYISGDYNSSIAGFHVGGSYERLLMSQTPLYFETGLYVSMKGSKFGGMEKYGFKETDKAYYLVVPIMVNYKIALGSDFAIAPGAGLYYGFGIGGNSKYQEDDLYQITSIKADMFGSDGSCKRSDLGMRVAVNATYKQFLFGLSYELGFLNILKSDVEDYATFNTRSFNITVGYKF